MTRRPDGAMQWLPDQGAKLICHLPSAPPRPHNLCNHQIAEAKFCWETRKRREMESAPVLWEAKVLCVLTLIAIYSMHPFLCLEVPVLHAVSQFLIPAIVTQP
jgi:hypothetical protein